MNKTVYNCVYYLQFCLVVVIFSIYAKTSKKYIDCDEIYIDHIQSADANKVCYYQNVDEHFNVKFCSKNILTNINCTKYLSDVDFRKSYGISNLFSLLVNKQHVFTIFIAKTKTPSCGKYLQNNACQ